MAHEIVPTAFPQLKIAEDHAGVPHRAIVRTSLIDDSNLAIVTRFTARKAATSAVIYLNTEDATALRDFLTDWLRRQRRKDNS